MENYGTSYVSPQSRGSTPKLTAKQRHEAEPKWERINDDTDRLPVLGGFLYRVTKRDYFKGGSHSTVLSVTFVPKV